MGTELHTDWLDSGRANFKADRTRRQGDWVQGRTGQFSDAEACSIQKVYDLRDESTRKSDHDRVPKGD